MTAVDFAAFVERLQREQLFERGLGARTLIDLGEEMEFGPSRAMQSSWTWSAAGLPLGANILISAIRSMQSHSRGSGATASTSTVFREPRTSDLMWRKVRAYESCFISLPTRTERSGIYSRGQQLSS